MAKQQQTQPKDYFQSQSQKNRVGRKVLNSTRTVFLMHALVLVTSFAVGLGLVSQMGESRAATNWRISPSGNDSNPCTASQPCLTMNRAYQVASPGDTVEMAGGSYVNNTFGPATKGLNADYITFKPVTGATVNFAYIRLNGVDNIEIQNVTSSGWYINSGSDRVIMRNVKSFVGGTFITSSSNISIINNEIANQNPSDGMQIKAATGGAQVQNLLIDGLWMHDLSRSNDLTAHTDCIQLASGINFTIRNSKFVNCSTQGLFINTFGGGVIDGGVIENNFFGPAQEGYNSLIIGNGSPVGSVKNILIRNNSLSQAGRTSYDPAPPNVRWYNNISPKTAFSCSSERNAGVIHENNVYSNSCTGNFTDANLLTSYVNSSNSNSATWDLHLKAGAYAIDRIPAGNTVTSDIDGHARPVNGSYDAGADEFGSAGGGTIVPAPPPAVPSAPVVTISSSPTTLQSGASSTLTWSSTNSPSSCTASGDWSGSKAASGTQSTGALNTVKTYTYNLACTNSGGTGSASATVAVSAAPPVTPPAPVITLSVSPSTINQGASSTIAWSATNSPTSCTASGDWSGSKAASGTQSTGALNTVKTYTYNLACTNSGGTTNGSVALVVLPVKPVVSISASPTTVKVGSSSSLTWNATNSPSNCTASGDWSGTKSATGTETTAIMSTKKTYTYTLTCSNNGGSSSASTAVTANTSGASKGPKPKVRLSVSPEVVEQGQVATLSWVAEDGSNISCVAGDGWTGEKAATGTENVTPDEDGQTYSITCDNENGGESASVAVSVANIKEDGSVTVNKTTVPNLKVENPSIVGESKAGEPVPLSQKSTDSGFAKVAPVGPLSTTTGKLTLAGVFAGLVTTAVGGAYVAHHNYNWRLPFLSFFRRGKGDGDGPIDMISG